MSTCRAKKKALSTRKCKVLPDSRFNGGFKRAYISNDTDLGYIRIDENLRRSRLITWRDIYYHTAQFYLHKKANT